MDADLSHDPAQLPALIAATARRRRRDRLALRARRRDRQLAAAAPAAQPVRQHLHPHGHAARARATAPAAIAAGGARRSPRCRSIGSSPTAIRSSSRCCSWRRARGCRIAEVPITFVERRQGESKLSRAVICSSRRSRRGGWSRRAQRPRSTTALRPFSCYGLGTFYMSAPAAAKPAGLSVFFPAYNDSGTIASMVIRAVQAASELTPDYEVIVVNDGSADATAGDRRRARAHLSARPRRASPEEPRLRRRAADRLPLGDQGADLLHRRRRAVRPGGAGAAVGAA